jgi:hypothetical protein
MKNKMRWLLTLGIVLGACLQIIGCASAPAMDNSGYKPAKIVHIQGTDLNQVILTADAVKRVGIVTDVVRAQGVGATQRLVIPYAAVLYDVQGQSWVYTNPTPLTYVRASITVATITGNQVTLTAGPPAGTVIVTVGAPELYGAEYGVGDEA